MDHLFAIALASVLMISGGQNLQSQMIAQADQDVIVLSEPEIKNPDATPTQIIQKLLENPTNLEHTLKYLSKDFVYVSLNYQNDDLNKIMPWAGTHHGPESFTKVFKGVYERWTVDEFTPEAAFDDGTNVAIFGSFTLRSRTLDRARKSPFAIFAKVNDEGKITYFQYMEDTFATADTFRIGGEWIFKPIPKEKVKI